MKPLLLTTFTICYLITMNCLSQTNLLVGPEGISYHQKSKSYFVSNATDGKIIKIDSLFNQSIIYEGLSVPMGVEIVGDSLYVASNDPSTITCLNVNNGDVAGSFQITETPSLAHMDIDKRTGLLYVIGQAGDVIKINTRSLLYNVFVESGLPNNIQTCSVDTTNNCLYIFSWPTTYVRSVNLNDSSDIQSLVNPLTGSYIDCTKDSEGNIYVSSWQGNIINKFQPGCLVVPEVFEAGFEKPAGLTYNPDKNLMAVCNFNGNYIDYIELTITGLESDIAKNRSTPEVFPNPFDTDINILLNDDQDAEVFIYNITGEIKKHAATAGKYNSIDLQDMSPGVYFMKIESNGKVYDKKIVKM